MVSALLSRCEAARALGRFRCGSGKIRPHCVDPGLLPLFRSKVSPSARSALDVCHWHTAPFAVRLFALLCSYAHKTIEGARLSRAPENFLRKAADRIARPAAVKSH